MTQTNQAISMVNNKIEISTDGSNWTDISGWSNEVSWDGGERASEKTNTYDGDTPILTRGKRDAVTVTLKIVYTEGLSDPIPTAQAAYDNNTNLFARWSPKNAVSGSKQYTTGTPGIVKKPVYPAGASSSAGAVLGEVVIETPSISIATL